MTRTIPDFYPLFETLLGLSRKASVRVVRFCREAGLIGRGKPGRTGGAAEVTPEALANIIIALLATDNREDAGRAAVHFGKLRAYPGRKCKLTAAPDFHDGLVKILSDPALAGRVEMIAISRTYGTVRVEYRDAAESLHVQAFVGAGRARALPQLELQAVIHGQALQLIAEELAA